MTRTVDPLTAFKMTEHKVGPYAYASTQPGTRDSVSGKIVYHRVHWGKLDENRKFFPLPRYILASPEQRAAFIFPDDWDLSEIRSFSGVRSQGRPPITTGDNDRLYGDVWLCERACDSLGLRQDLIAALDGNEELADCVLTLAFFLICVGESVHNLKEWQRLAKYPARREMTSSFITRVLQSIEAKHRDALLQARIRRLGKGATLAVDSTTRYSHGDGLREVKAGLNKDHTYRPQTLEVVVYSLTDHLPIYYRTMQGNCPDISTLETIIRELESEGLGDTVLVTDRGYESHTNLRFCIKRRQSLITATKVGQKHVLEKIKELGRFEYKPRDMEYDAAKHLCYREYPLGQWAKQTGISAGAPRDLKLNLYLNPDLRHAELSELHGELSAQGQKLSELRGERFTDEELKELADSCPFYTLEHKRGVLKDYTVNTEMFAKRELTAGFHANTVYRLKVSAPEARDLYRKREEQERYFAKMKGLLGVRAQRASTEASKRGFEFVVFTAGVISSYLESVRASKLAEEFPSLRKMLREMSSIRCLERVGHQPYMTPFVGKQKTVCEAFGLEIPKGGEAEFPLIKTRKAKPRAPKTTITNEDKSDN